MNKRSPTFRVRLLQNGYCCTQHSLGLWPDRQTYCTIAKHSINTVVHHCFETRCRTAVCRGVLALTVRRLQSSFQFKNRKMYGDSTPVKFFSKLNVCIFCIYFDPVNISFDNKNKYFSGWPKRHFGLNGNTALHGSEDWKAFECLEGTRYED